MAKRVKLDRMIVSWERIFSTCEETEVYQGSRFLVRSIAFHPGGMIWGSQWFERSEQHRVRACRRETTVKRSHSRPVPGRVVLEHAIRGCAAARQPRMALS